MIETSYSITKRIAELVEPVLDEFGYELVDVEYLSKHGKWVLQVFIDRTGGISIDDCVQVSRELGDLIDIKEIIEHEYVLEVSSPGVNRPLKKEKDFMRAIGLKIKATTKTPIKGRRNFTGRLEEFRNGELYIDINGKQIILPYEEIGKANIVYEFKF